MNFLIKVDTLTGLTFVAAKVSTLLSEPNPFITYGYDEFFLSPNVINSSVQIGVWALYGLFLQFVGSLCFCFGMDFTGNWRVWVVCWCSVQYMFCYCCVPSRLWWIFSELLSTFSVLFRFCSVLQFAVSVMCVCVMFCPSTALCSLLCPVFTMLFLIYPVPQLCVCRAMMKTIRM